MMMNDDNDDIIGNGINIEMILMSNIMAWWWPMKKWWNYYWWNINDINDVVLVMTNGINDN